MLYHLSMHRDQCCGHTSETGSFSNSEEHPLFGKALGFREENIVEAKVMQTARDSQAFKLKWNRQDIIVKLGEPVLLIIALLF